MLAVICTRGDCELVTLYRRRPRQLTTTSGCARGCARCHGPVELVPGGTAPAVWQALEARAATNGTPGHLLVRLRKRFEGARTRLEHREAVRGAVRAACEGLPWFVALEAESKALALYNSAQQKKRAKFMKWERAAVAAANAMHRSRRKLDA